ncbi:MAG: uroporphyrinogen-III C-methyltransferase [Gammaproteobacteria bacterium]|nr:uroporphyrinogen-III C-methyltransferase [Gammaproteobacteria bacterium]
MDYLPLFHRLQQQPVLLVGGGEVALRKAHLLCQAGALVHVVTLEIHPQLEQLLQKHGGTYELQAYQAGTCAGYCLVIAATENFSVNQQVAHEAKQLGIPVNVVDTPELCTVIFPAIVDRSPLMVAVSSGGHAPVLARLVRAKIETVIPATYGRLAQLAQKFRQQAKDRLAGVDERRVFWEEVLQGPIAEQVFAGKIQQAEQAVQNKLDAPQAKTQGEVYLVGAGPGDPDLLTFKALRLMQQADVVLYDRLVAPAIVDMCRRDADRVYVGKAASNHSLPQEQINQKLVDLAKQGKRVLRLKGGDPFIFGRGGEEIEELAQHGVPFQVVPGITSAAGCSSYAGIPLTHRDYAQSVRFVTGHPKDGSLNLPWTELVSNSQTVVFYMGLGTLPDIAKQLMAHGRSSETPVAVIERGTTPEQRVIVGCLADIAIKIIAEQVQSPSLIIVGEVVSLKERLSWFSEKSKKSVTETACALV